MVKDMDFKMKKKKMGVKPTDLIIAVLLILATAFFIYTTLTLNVIPDKYMIPAVVSISMIAILVSSFIVFNKKRFKTKLVLKILSVFMTIFLLFISRYSYKMIDFLKDINTNTNNVKNYSVIVLKTSSASVITDLKGKDIGYYHNDAVNQTAALDKLQEVSSATLKAELDVNTLGENLLSKEYDAILVEDSYKAMIEEEDPTFEEKTRVIYTFQIEIDTQSITKEVSQITTDCFNVYISGIDTYGKIGSVSRSDVNIVASVNPKTRQILLVSIPRDYYVKLNGTYGYRDKLTHAGIYGVEKSVATIEDLLDIDINYYVKVNFTSVIDIVNALGGIKVYSDHTFSAQGYDYIQGYNYLNGKKALAFARERYSFAEGDRARGKHQQAVIAGLLEKASSYTVIAKFDSLLESLNSKFQTNMDYKKMLALVKFQAADMQPWNLSTYNLNGAGGKEYTYSMGKRPLYVMIPYVESIQGAKDAIKKLTEGEILEKTYESKGTTKISYTKTIPKVTIKPAPITTNNVSVVAPVETPPNNVEETNTEANNIVDPYTEG